MANWDEYRTAFHVAKEGTVSGAAAVLGVHHATVIRHVDALEGRLGTKLFQRHARGYTTTEAGEDLLQVAQTTDDQLAQLENRLKGRGNEVGGELVVTSAPGLSYLLVPAITSFGRKYPSVSVRYLTSQRVFRLEYGEAHIAIRAGKSPQEPDNVVQKLSDTSIRLYAAQSYIDRKGMPGDPLSFSEHDFVASETIAARAPFYRWLYGQISPERAVFRSTETQALINAIIEGAGMGFLAPWIAAKVPGMVDVLKGEKEWITPLWLVTHMDLHRTAKVQAFLTHLKAEAANWKP